MVREIIPDFHRDIILKGALYFKKHEGRRVNRYAAELALWVVLENEIGDSDFTFRVMLTIPEISQFLESAEHVVTMLDDVQRVRQLNRIRSSLFVWSRRGTTLGKDAV
jgi:hypothetical protein